MNTESDNPKKEKDNKTLTPVVNTNYIQIRYPFAPAINQNSS